jgi:Uma2 family endonuclease
MQHTTRPACRRGHLSCHEPQRQDRAEAFSRRTPARPVEPPPVKLDVHELALIDRLVRGDRTAVWSALLRSLASAAARRCAGPYSRRSARRPTGHGPTGRSARPGGRRSLAMLSGRWSGPPFAAVSDAGRGRSGRGTLQIMPTLVRDPQPAEFEALLERRQRLGQDLLDEVWEGVYHVNPVPHRKHANVVQQLAVLLDGPTRAAGLVPMVSIFNLGGPDDYRVPDGGVFRPGPDEVFASTAALVVEVVSPQDETWEKLPFYAPHGVEELLIVDPETRRVHWLALSSAGEYQPIDRSELIELSPVELARRISWLD